FRLDFRRIIIRRKHAGFLAEAFRKAGATLIERYVADLLVYADRFRAAHFREPGAGDLAGIEFRLADVKQRAQFMGDVRAGVHRNHWNAGIYGALDRRAERIAVGDRHDEPVGFLVDGGIDHLAHQHHVEGFRRAEFDIDAGILGRLFDAILHTQPERTVGLPMATAEATVSSRLLAA